MEVNKNENGSRMESDIEFRQTESSASDSHKSSDCINIISYSSLQKKIKGLYTFIQEFIDDEQFKTHIKMDAHNMDTIEEQLSLWKKDDSKTECPIVIAGETSSGKSSIINLIVGEKILPTGITASTSRVCRIRYSEQMMISTCNKDETELKSMAFTDRNKMVETLSDLAQTTDSKISYVDIYFPVSMLQGNVIIVDTPGTGDFGQEEVAKKMRSYLPNALAFVFVVNVSNAGGLQDDRLLRTLSYVRDSMNQMVSFCPEDVIFLLNKWDTLSDEDEKDIEEYLKKSKQILHRYWEELDESCVFKVSATKALKKEPEYTRLFDSFVKVLKDVITKSEKKRVGLHLGFIRNFLDECDRVLSTKLLCVEQKKEENKNKLDQASRDLNNLENIRKREYQYMTENIDIFLDEAAKKLHDYIHCPIFRATILLNIEKIQRLWIANELDKRIEVETMKWQKKNINNIFYELIMKRLTEKFQDIHQSLHSIKCEMRGIKTPFDVDNKIPLAVVSYVIPSGTALLGSVVMTRITSDPSIILGVAAVGVVSGLVCSALTTLEVLDDSETVCKNAYIARMNVLTKEKIRFALEKRYADVIRKIIHNFLEGDLKSEISQIISSITSMQGKRETYKADKDRLISLLSTVTDALRSLDDLELLEIKTG